MCFKDHCHCNIRILRRDFEILWVKIFYRFINKLKKIRVRIWILAILALYALGLLLVLYLFSATLKTSERGIPIYYLTIQLEILRGDLDTVFPRHQVNGDHYRCNFCVIGGLKNPRPVNFNKFFNSSPQNCRSLRGYPPSWAPGNLGFIFIVIFVLSDLENPRERNPDRLFQN